MKFSKPLKTPLQQDIWELVFYVFDSTAMETNDGLDESAFAQSFKLTLLPSADNFCKQVWTNCLRLS